MRNKFKVDDFVLLFSENDVKYRLQTVLITEINKETATVVLINQNKIDFLVKEVSIKSLIRFEDLTTEQRTITFQQQ